ncbi:MAG: Rv3235 family protein [Pseudonocardiaceae bacterium]
MTTSIAEPRPQLPVLRRLVDLLPPPATSQAVATTQPATVTVPAADPEATALAERVLRAAVEIVAGRRPARQLSPVLGPDQLAYLARLKASASHLQPRVCKVFAQQQGAGVLEAVALVALNTGVRALAARFEVHTDGRWRCTALQLRLTAGDMTVHRHARRSPPARPAGG